MPRLWYDPLRGDEAATMRTKWFWMIAGAALLMGSTNGAEPAARPFKTYNTQNYILKTDVDDELAREAQLRIDRMFDEYALRTREFAQRPKERLPFVLYSRKEDYVASGEMEASAGVFKPSSGVLKAIVKENYTWHVVQHEGFHQFAFSTISRQLPTWVDEGLADFFGESMFTGDGFVTGLIPMHRHERVVAMINDQKYMPFAKFVSLSQKQWNQDLKGVNYDQAWSMVHFLVMADEKYQKAFAGYMKALSRNVGPEQAWQQQFGVGAGDASFEAAWKKYWLSLPERPTQKEYLKARAMTMTSFLARAALSGKKYESMKDFLRDAAAGKVPIMREQEIWLPASLLKEWISEQTDAGEFLVKWNGMLPTLVDRAGDVTITVEYKNGKTVATVKDASATTKPK